MTLNKVFVKMGGLSRWVNEKEIRTLGKNEEFVTVVKKKWR